MLKSQQKKQGAEKLTLRTVIRVANNLLQGLQIYTSLEIDGAEKLREDITKLGKELTRVLTEFINAVLKSENNVVNSGMTSAAAR